MKKFLSLAVLLVTTLVGFTACNNDDESDDAKSLSKTTFTATQHVSDAIKTGDLTYTVSFNDDAQCVMRVESRNMKLLNIDKTYSDDTFYGGTYTKDGNTITFNVNCITTEAGEHSYSVIDHPETHTFTYNPDTKVLTIDGGLQLNSTKFARLECKKYAPSNVEVPYNLDNLIGYWEAKRQYMFNDNYVTLLILVNRNGNSGIVGTVEDWGGTIKKQFAAEGPISIGKNSFTIDGWTTEFEWFGSDYFRKIKVYDQSGKLFLEIDDVKHKIF